LPEILFFVLLFGILGHICGRLINPEKREVNSPYRPYGPLLQGIFKDKKLKLIVNNLNVVILWLKARITSG